MNIHNYSVVTKEFVSTTEAVESPLEPGVFLIPGCATTVAVGTPAEGCKQVFNTTLQEWEDKYDYRGQSIYNIATSAMQLVIELGVIPEGFTLTVPGAYDSWVDGAWAFDSAKALVAIRAERNGRLIACDFTQLTDVPFTVEKKAEWAVYRQALRDFPETCNPASPVWPTQPA